MYSSFNYCPLVWHFSKSVEKNENIWKHYLRLTLNDNKSDYKTLLDKSGKESMKNRRIKKLPIEIFKTVNELNPNIMKTIFVSKTNSRVWPFDLLVRNCNSENSYGAKTKHMEWTIWKCKKRTKHMEYTTGKYKKKYHLAISRNIWISSPGPTCKLKICLRI